MKRDSLARISEESGVSATRGGVLATGTALLSAPLVILSGTSMCLYNAVRSLCLPELYDVPMTDGPFSVSRYNENVRRYAQPSDIQQTPVYLALRDKSAPVGTEAGRRGEYV